MAIEFWAWFKQDLGARRGMKMGPHQPKKKALLVLSCLKMGIYKTAVSKELKIRIEKIQDNL